MNTEYFKELKYIIQTTEGLYYTGKAGEDAFSDRKDDAHTYTLNGAHHKISRCCSFLQDAQVLRLP